MNERIADPDKAAAADRLRWALASATGLRAAAKADPARQAARTRVREWQAQRLARTHADLLASERYRLAAEFFLSDLYGAKDFSERDADIERILPTMVAFLPAAGIATVAMAIEVDALSEELDADMAAALAGVTLDEANYAQAYRKCARRPDREHQIALITEVGEALARLTRRPLLGAGLKLMRRPAHMAGMGALHDFLQRGYDAFRHMGNADEFLRAIVRREKLIMQRLFRGDAQPFAALT